ncbi:pentapeptide repeat-containing protein [Streptomyces sp. NPDC001982]|uniref:pentapeptide repeat-containing protein n=1 Tax=Streptomyces sp. NPDC001982 TaxID=3154405 RepID=UPI00332319BA
MAAVGAGVALLYTARSYHLTRRGQVTERFTKALERLGSTETYVRLGGVLALEQIVQDAPEQSTHAAQVLSHFVRDRVPARPSDAAVWPDSDPETSTGRSSGEQETRDGDSAELPERPYADVQAALTALTRPASRTHVDTELRLDFAGLHLHGATLIGADLTDADLEEADLAYATLFEANLTGANLIGTNFYRARMSDAIFTKACLEGANLNNVVLRETNLRGFDVGGADLTYAELTGCDLTKANFYEAKLLGATLHRADLTGANLTRANLSHASLTGATLTDADLSGANLTDVQGLSAAQLRTALIDDKTQLPPEIEAQVRTSAR